MVSGSGTEPVATQWLLKTILRPLAIVFTLFGVLFFVRQLQDAPSAPLGSLLFVGVMAVCKKRDV